MLVNGESATQGQAAAEGAMPAPAEVENAAVAAGSLEGAPEQPPFTVRDRRSWTNPADADVDPATDKKPSFVQELEAKLADKEERLQATLRQYKEALDDFEGTKVRLRREVGKEIEAGKRAILSDLLDVMDNLERAIEPADAEGESGSLLTGVKMVRDGFLAKLQHLGVQRVDAHGQLFDPARFEAISTVPVSDVAQDGRVVGVVRTCYLLGQEVLRPGMVAVGKHAAPRAAA